MSKEKEEVKEETKKVNRVEETEKLIKEKQEYLNQLENAKSQTVAEINFLMGKLEVYKETNK